MVYLYMQAKPTIYGKLETLEELTGDTLNKYVYVNTNQQNEKAQFEVQDIYKYKHKSRIRKRKLTISYDVPTKKYTIIEDTFNYYTGLHCTVKQLADLLNYSSPTIKTTVNIENAHLLFYALTKLSDDYCCIHDDLEEIKQFVINGNIFIKKIEEQLSNTKHKNYMIEQFLKVFQFSQWGNTPMEKQFIAQAFPTYQVYAEGQTELSLEDCYNCFCYSRVLLSTVGSKTPRITENAYANDMSNAYAIIASTVDLPYRPRESKTIGRISFGIQRFKVTLCNKRTDFAKNRTKNNQGTFQYWRSNYWNVKSINGYIYMPSILIYDYINYLQQQGNLLDVEYCGGIEFDKCPKGLLNSFFQTLLTMRDNCESEEEKFIVKKQINNLYGFLQRRCIKVCVGTFGKSTVLCNFPYQILIDWIRSALALTMHKKVQQYKELVICTNIDCIYSKRPLNDELFKRPSYSTKEVELPPISNYVELSETQLKLFSKVMRDDSKEIIIQAPAGTGKSELLRWLLSEKVRLHGETSSCVMAYTGNALQLLVNKGVPIRKSRMYTLARGTEVHEWSPYTGFNTIGKILTKWHVDYIFIDEYSLLSDETCNYLKEHCKQLILFGDYNQLGAIGGTNIELTKRAKLTQYKLTENFRNSKKILDIIDSLENSDSIMIPQLTNLPLNMTNTQILANNHTICTSINEQYKQVIDRRDCKIRVQGNYYNFGIYTGTQMSLGELEDLCKRNNREMYELIGAESIQTQDIKLPRDYTFEDFASFLISCKRIYFRLAFCITVDSAQGGEWDNVIFATNSQDGRINKTIYTIISRAKQNIYIYTT